MTDTLLYSTTLDVLSCGSCGIPFAMPRNIHQKREADGGWFWCPNGDKIHYTTPENQKLKRDLDYYRNRARHLDDQLDAAERSRSALRGVITRQKNRAAAGVCPAGCKRHFSDLQAHMETKHPQYAASGDHQ